MSDRIRFNPTVSEETRRALTMGAARLGIAPGEYLDRVVALSEEILGVYAGDGARIDEAIARARLLNERTVSS